MKITAIDPGTTESAYVVWNKFPPNEPPKNVIISVKIRHCNPRLNLSDEIISGYMGEDNFYLKDGGELSYNWDILKWRIGE